MYVFSSFSVSPEIIVMVCWTYQSINVLCSREIYQISIFWGALKYIPIICHTDITDLKKPYRCINLLPWNFATCTLCQSLLSEVLVGLLTVQCINNGKSCKVSRGQSQNRSRWTVLYCTQKLPFGLMKNIFTYSDMWIPIICVVVVFLRIRWAKESEMTYTWSVESVSVASCRPGCCGGVY